MNSLDAYDEALAYYFKNSRLVVSPLLSWDVHMDNYIDSSLLQKDITAINKITKSLQIDVNLIEELIENRAVIVITDTNLNIEFASSNMIRMTGYQPFEVVGNTPKMFQGEATDKVLSSSVRESVKNEEPFDVILKNYKKDKSIYECHIMGYPILNKAGKLVKFVAVERAA